MEELAKGDTNSNPLLPNILDTDDEFMLRSPQQPLPAPQYMSSSSFPQLESSIIQEDAYGRNYIPSTCNVHMPKTPAPTQNDHEYLPTYNYSPCFKCHLPINPTINRWPEHKRVEPDATYSKGPIEKELKNILREIRVITDKIRDEVKYGKMGDCLIFQ